jgi:hypothetical protein
MIRRRVATTEAVKKISSGDHPILDWSDFANFCS